FPTRKGIVISTEAAHAFVSSEAEKSAPLPYRPTANDTPLCLPVISQESAQLSKIIQPLDHHVGRLDKSSRRITLLQLKFPNRIRRNNRSHTRIFHREHNLSQKPLDTYTHDLAHKLISPAHPPIALARLDRR